MLDFLPYIAAALLYTLVAFLQWHTKKFASGWYERVAVATGLALHGWLLAHDMFTGNGVNLGLINALSAIFWLTVLIYWLASLKYNLHALQAFVLPPATLFVLLQKLVPESHVLPYTGDALFGAHLVIALLAYSLFTFAALHAGLMAIAERSLHNKTPLFRLPDFPPIMPMERLLFQIIGIGFVLLTLTLVSGIFFTEQLFHQALQFNHKTVFSIAAWLIFGALLVGRRVQGWRGRVAVRWTLGGFVLLLLAYVGSKFVLEVLLGR
ncbi:MAG TPA: cytochrome c biogenesis protein CcsA [Methylophilaceae bacterium]|nr:cytochrome c biogenesis protein CcsA [Methylophilaceae bacterium]HQR60594.1 cytochrome c biogenesis protein CcsA [Methylophilaceae bacterium]